MAKENRLKPIQKLAEREAAARSREVSERLFHLRAEEQRLEQLESYLAEYAALADQATHPALNISTMQSRHDFYRRLTECVAHQQDLVDTLCTQLEHFMDRWNDARARSLAYQKFAERLDAEVVEKTARRDQALLDEAGQQQFLRQR